MDKIVASTTFELLIKYDFIEVLPNDNNSDKFCDVVYFCII